MCRLYFSKFSFSVYEQRAVEILTAFYKQNNKSAVDVVKTRIPLWGFKNPVSLAANGNARDFVAHTCCQTYLKDIWSGRVSNMIQRLLNFQVSHLF